jgi:hypothetical protein
MGAENPVLSCDLDILVDEAAESVSSQWPDDRCGSWSSAALGRALLGSVPVCCACDPDLDRHADEQRRRVKREIDEDHTHRAGTRYTEVPMKAIVATDQAAEAAGITLAQRPQPTPAIKDVVVEVHASGFVHAYEHQVDESEGHIVRSCWLSSGRWC